MTHRLLRTALVAALMVVSTGAFAQGLLIPRDEAVTPLALTSHRVDFEIRERGAVTHVTQIFRNHTSTNLEATYYFAVPPGAVTTDFAIWMNGERIAGEVLPRDQARQTYENIVRRMRDPGLLEYIDGELFQASIFPVPANGEQTVEIEYATVVERQGTMLHYRYPIHESASAEIPSFVVSGEVESSHNITTVYAPYHEVETIEERGGRRVRVSMEEVGMGTAEDFELFVGLTGEDLGFSLLTFDDDDGEDGYFMLTLAPSPDLEELEVLPKQVTLVVDTSGSMAGDKIDQAQEMLRYCVENLGRDDMFQIIGFSSGVNPAFDEPVRATRENVDAALAFISTLRARGNTNISGALERALDDPASPERPHAIIFVTDGLPTEGDTDVDDILDIAGRGISDGDRRVFAFGVGYDVNTRLLDGVARRGRGETGYVRPNEDMSDVVGEFVDTIGSPLLTHLEIDFGRVDVDDVYPSPLPDLYREREITIFGRYEASSSDQVVVRGQAAGGRDWTMEYGATFMADTDANTNFVANLWAHRRVDALLTEIEDRGESQRRIDEIVELATAWGIVTPYTSYLAMDPNEQLWQPTPEPMWEDDSIADREMPRAGGGRATRRFDMDEEAEAAAEPMWDAPGDMGGFDGLAAGSTGSRSSSRNRGPASRPAPTVPVAQAETGRDAVERSIQRNEERSSLTLTETDARRAAGRNFERLGGVWVQTDIGGRSVDERVGYMSEEYFALLRDHPELRDVLALGERVRFELGGRIYEIVP